MSEEKKTVEENLDEILDVEEPTSDVEDILPPDIDNNLPTVGVNNNLPSTTPTNVSPSKDVEVDYNESRRVYNQLITAGTDAIESLLDLAKGTDSPRAYEALAILLKNTADTTEKLMNLQKDKRDLQPESSSNKQPVSTNTTTTNNNVFVGSTAELQDMLQKLKNENNTP